MPYLALAVALAATVHTVLSRAAAACTSSASPEPACLLAQTQRGKGEAEDEFFGACGRIGLRATLLQEVQVEASCGDGVAHVEATNDDAGSRAGVFLWALRLVPLVLPEEARIRVRSA